MIVENMPERMRLFPLLATYAGLRRSELLGLRRRDVDVVHRTLSVAQTIHHVSPTARWWRRGREDGGRSKDGGLRCVHRRRHKRPPGPVRRLGSRRSHLHRSEGWATSAARARQAAFQRPSALRAGRIPNPSRSARHTSGTRWPQQPEQRCSELMHRAWAMRHQDSALRATFMPRRTGTGSSVKPSPSCARMPRSSIFRASARGLW